MRYNLKATNMEVVPAVAEYLEKRLQALEKFIDPNDEACVVDIEIGKTTRHHQSGDVFRAEINVYRGKENFRAVSERSDVNSAIDGAKDEMLRSLAATKGRRLSLLKRGGQQVKGILRRLYRRGGRY